MPARPTEQELRNMYFVEKLGIYLIARKYGVTGQAVWYWFKKAGIKLSGPSFLVVGRTNESARRKRTPEEVERLRKIATGRTPHNKGRGIRTFNCECCGVEVTDQPYHRKRVCSDECRKKLSAKLRGKNHWNYKGDLAGSRQRARNWSIYREWRAAVMKAACYKCAKCQKVGGRLTAHHIKSFSEYPDDRYDVANGACLCKSCHWAIHRTLGHRNSSHDLFQSWLEGG